MAMRSISSSAISGESRGAAPFDHTRGIDPAQPVLSEAALLRHGASKRPLRRIAERGCGTTRSFCAYNSRLLIH
jgi:hypothetical protein